MAPAGPISSFHQPGKSGDAGATAIPATFLRITVARNQQPTSRGQQHRRGHI
jgi:hypothetical protein